MIMISKLNRNGFTLVELLAVLVILVAIMGIAIPSISSSLERTKNQQNESRYKVLESAAELYVTDHKNAIYQNLGVATSCYIVIGDLGDYLSKEEMKDSDNQDLSGNYIIFTKPNDYKYSTTNGSYSPC